MIPLYNALMPAFQDHLKAFELFVELVSLYEFSQHILTCTVDEIHGKMAMYFFILLPFYKV